MYKEWLLIVWVGTSTNFTLLEYHPSFPQCKEAMEIAKEDFKEPFVVECRQDMREGRSTLPKRGINVGVTKK
jgi:hypothetical protein